MPSATLGHLYRTARWRRIRDRQLTERPLCEICIETETITPANTVHHRDGGHKGDIAKFWIGPFQSLCASCHSRHGALEDRGTARIRFGVDGYPI